MQILIVYASAGAGHKKAAEALYDYIKERSKEAEVLLFDVLEKTTPFFRLSYEHGYNFLVSHALILWRFSFWLTNFKPIRPISRSIALFVNRINTIYFCKFLSREQPDLIISTHFLPSAISSYLKYKNKIKSKLVTVITDFGVHNYWISKGTDLYIVASESTKQELIREDVDASRIKALGIPIASKFKKVFDIAGLKRKLNMDADKFTVLVMTGSFGLGPLEEIINVLRKDVQLLVVCAANKKLYGRLTNKKWANVKVLGFVDNVEELMAVSNIIITKAGGLSISEILTMELVPIFISVIPGQEENNVLALKSYGVGFSPKSIEDLRKIVLDLKEHPQELNYLKENIRKVKKPDAVGEIYNAVC